MIFQSRTSSSLAAALLLTVVGCQSDGDPADCESICPGAIPLPAGTSVTEWNLSQTMKADQDLLVVYQHEWRDADVALSPFGIRHVRRIADRLRSDDSLYVMMEESGSPELDSHRVTALAEFLAAAQVVSAHDRVQTGQPQAEGMHGLEASPIASGYLQGDIANPVQGGSRAGANSGNVFGGSRSVPGSGHGTY